MKLVSFIAKSKKPVCGVYDRRPSYGAYSEGRIVDLGCRLGERYPDIKALLARGGLSDARACLGAEPDYREDELVFLPIIGQPGKIFCVGMNYAEKRREFGETNDAPTLFVRFPDSQTGHACPVLKPSHTDEFDYEGELAVVIGKAGRAIRKEDALAHVAGYSCYMDGSVRDWQHTWFTAGKNWRQTGAFGPWLVTADEIPDPQALDIRTYLNGRTVQDDNTGNMIHTIPELIAYISTFSALSPGDVIITGSPGSVGKKRVPPLFLKEGDVVEVEIERIGRLRNHVVKDAVAA
jgi:2-keto-4-pentenoate hydratase/2-oxohepta-3-ene-1,7-dioic acid hydratase in catechol pathway